MHLSIFRFLCAKKIQKTLNLWTFEEIHDEKNCVSENVRWKWFAFIYFNLSNSFFFLVGKPLLIFVRWTRLTRTWRFAETHKDRSKSLNCLNNISILFNQYFQYIYKYVFFYFYYDFVQALMRNKFSRPLLIILITFSRTLCLGFEINYCDAAKLLHCTLISGDFIVWLCRLLKSQSCSRNFARKSIFSPKLLVIKSSWFKTEWIRLISPHKVA